MAPRLFLLPLLLLCGLAPADAADPVQHAVGRVEYITGLTADEARELRQQTWDYLQQTSGLRAFPTPKLPAGKAAHSWHAYSEYKNAKGDKKKMYGLVGIHLRLAEQLMATEDEAVRRSGLGVLRWMTFGITQHLKDPRVAEAVVAGWLLRNIHLAHPKFNEMYSAESILTMARRGYTFAEDHDKAARAGIVWYEIAHDQNTKDTACLRIAECYARLGDYREGLRYLYRIPPDSSLQNARDMIPKFQEKAAQQPTPETD